MLDNFGLHTKQNMFTPEGSCILNGAIRRHIAWNACCGTSNL